MDKIADFSNLILTEEQKERLYLLIEECSEVIQSCSKILRFGYDSCHPEKDYKTNKELLISEIGDLYAVLDILYDNGDINYLLADEYRNLKKEKIDKYMKYNPDPYDNKTNT